MNRCTVGAIATLLCLWAAEASADATPVPTGSWQGGGRACAGKLDISKRALSWRTPFSRCVGLPFKVNDMGEQGGIHRTRFNFERSAPGCPFASVDLLRKPGGPPGQAGDERWEAIGYRSQADAQAGRLDDALACSLVRLK